MLTTITVSARWAHYVDAYVEALRSRVRDLPDWAADPGEPGSIEVTVRRVPAVDPKEAA